MGRKNFSEFEKVMNDKKTSKEQKILAEMIYTLLSKRVEKKRFHKTKWSREADCLKAWFRKSRISMPIRLLSR